MLKLTIVALIGMLGFTGCASVQPRPTPVDLRALRETGELTTIPSNAPSFERGF